MSTDTAFVGRYTRYPDLMGKRKAEGGKRLRGELAKGRTDEPLVTIITVCWNSARTIEQTIRSVLDQTYRNIEYLIIDGASTDGTLDILHKYDAEIDYYLSEPDEGLYFAMNKGLELARGEYILILNSDDWYEPECVKSLLNGLNYSGADFVTALAQYVDADGRPTEIMRGMSYDESIHIRMPLRHETMLISASIYNDVGQYSEQYKIIADSELSIRIFLAGYTNYEIPKALLNFRNNGVSNNLIAERFEERARLIKAHFEFLSVADVVRLADPRVIEPSDLAAFAERYCNHPVFVRSIKAYHRDRRRVSQVAKWRESNVGYSVTCDGEIFVSVVLPFYKAEKSLACCISSVLAQSLKNIELICINDASPDNSKDIVKRFSLEDDRVIYVENEKNIGQGPSRNKGKHLARGQYIFFIDSDDTLPVDALRKLFELAVAHDSDIVRGAFVMEQTVFGEQSVKKIRKGLCSPEEVIVNTNLKNYPNLLRTTEGHWSQLYRASLAKAVPYHDLRIGQDSVFMVAVLLRAQRVTITGEIVYQYRANPDSVMNTNSFIKYLHALEWRRRAWHFLRDWGQPEIGCRLLAGYWNESFISGIVHIADDSQVSLFFNKFRTALGEAEITKLPENLSPFLLNLFRLILEHRDNDAMSLMKAQPMRLSKASSKAHVVPYSAQPVTPSAELFHNAKLRVATFSSMDHGGAGLGSQRRVEALRRQGIDAHIYCAFQKTGHDYVHKVPYAKPLAQDVDYDTARKAWRNAAVLTRIEQPKLKARELFSKPGSIVDFRDLVSVFDWADIVHLHWVTGMFDFENSQMLANKPVVWTLADMNAFTGGCHYSEGCDGYKKECKKCPLIGGDADLAHKAWQKKRASYAEIKNLHIICPSQWLADCARGSSLFGGRPVHMIPNAFPIDRFIPTNKLVARGKLGLPLDKKLVVFGADSLTNRRKGGDILVESMRYLRDLGQRDGIEGVFFGAANLDLGVKSHNLGHIADESKLSLIYAAGDVYAFPSREDNAPLTVVESLLSGTPVVAFPVGNVPELLHHKKTGFIAQYGNARDFAAGLAWILSASRSPESISRGLRGCLAARQHNDPIISVSRHLEVYKEMRAELGRN